MMHKLMYWLTGFLKCRLITVNDAPYLERYYVGTIFGKRIFIHRFMASDPDRGLHNHPWKWAISFILVGGYDELITKDNRLLTVKRRAFTINTLNGNSLHRVLLPEQFIGSTWTLFIHGGRNKGWGFLEYETDEDDFMTETHFNPVNLKVERKQNQSWWKRKDAKTGKERRNEVIH